MYLGFTSCLVQNFRFRASLEKMLCLTKKVANKNVISRKLYILWQLYLFRIDFRMSALCVQNLRVEPQTERFLERLKFLIFFQNFEKQHLVKVEYLKKKNKVRVSNFQKKFSMSQCYYIANLMCLAFLVTKLCCKQFLLKNQYF